MRRRTARRVALGFEMIWRCSAPQGKPLSTLLHECQNVVGWTSTVYIQDNVIDDYAQLAEVDEARGSMRRACRVAHP